MKTQIEAMLDRVRLHEKYVATFSTPEGKEVLSHILKIGHVFATTFVRGDINETMLKEGERRLALSILRFVSRDHGEIQKLAQQTYEEMTDAR